LCGKACKIYHKRGQAKVINTRCNFSVLVLLLISLISLILVFIEQKILSKIFLKGHASAAAQAQFLTRYSYAVEPLWHGCRLFVCLSSSA